MGNYFASSMQESMRKNQEAMQKSNMERQKQMQQEMQRTQMAMQIARSRELCVWVTTFYVTVAAGLINGYRKTKKPFLVAPLVPLTFVTLYYLDLAYGNKLHRIRLEADHIMTYELDLLKLPSALPAPVDIEEKKN